MKIRSGSFGIKGSAFFSRDILAVEGSTSRDYKADEIQSLNTRTEVYRKFGLLGALVGGVLLAVLGFLVFNIVGALIGIALAYAGSFYSEKQHVADLVFKDGNALTAVCTPREIGKLAQFYNG